MTIGKLHKMLGELMRHGVLEEAEVYAYDPNSEQYEPVSCAVYTNGRVDLYTDDIS
jgi:hypothetical protein